MIRFFNVMKKNTKDISPFKEALHDHQLHTSPTLSPKDKHLLKTIQDKTQLLNKNNIMRTKAYLDYYQKHPEIQWSLLAHMVSRNAGWNMTDLKGEFLPKLLSPKEQNDFFHMLERGNWLIFQDAFPQLLLYEESKRKQKSLFYLLPYFGVSVFMKAMWEHFWKEPNQELLSIALIINEQHYIEDRVIQNPTYQQSVLDILEFQLQDVLSMNQMLFPCEENNEIKLVGATVHHFASLYKRIEFGKSLYTLLFSDKLPFISKWAKNKVHTGSRQDYWSNVFQDKKEAVPGVSYPPRFKNCSISYNYPRFYSPQLSHVWKKVHHTSPQIGDWYHDEAVVDLLNMKGIPFTGEIKPQYCETLERLDLIVSTKNLIFPKR
ncbi:DUF2515 family protein [Pontibacillus marinus]|uniref:DUF2515 domain-containing protein n=1 Tax=Pontibacillus marinus BH030004 = DSM 16465 TaxID=1385511 RepID=A0A0A5G8S6_9BACI|nr:DUF2515 family protein [Pontibacillus marinus]KGX89536.1 hypothetical protein N783_05370 [Pontibacillus marinus BH030004 = DSM 16465]